MGNPCESRSNCEQCNATGLVLRHGRSTPLPQKQMTTINLVALMTQLKKHADPNSPPTVIRAGTRIVTDQGRDMINASFFHRGRRKELSRRPRIRRHPGHVGTWAEARRRSGPTQDATRGGRDDRSDRKEKPNDSRKQGVDRRVTRSKQAQQRRLYTGRRSPDENLYMG